MEESKDPARQTPMTASPLESPHGTGGEGDGIERKEYRLEDGTVLWQGPLKLGQVLEIARRVTGLDLQGIITGDKMAELLGIILEPPELIKGLNLAEAVTADLALEMIDDFFTLNPRTAKILSGLSSAIPLWFARGAIGGSPSNDSTESNPSSGLPISSAEATSASGNG